MFSYIRFNCKKCEKKLEYAVLSEFGASVEIENVVPILATIADGGVVRCSCGIVYSLQCDGRKLEAIITDDNQTS